jgi:hypothetical protein
LLESEDSKTIYHFLDDSLRKQKKISIGTDFKQEYGEAIDKLKVKHQFPHIFQKVFPKHIKRTMKIEQGFLKRFVLKLYYWNIKKENQKNYICF